MIRLPTSEEEAARMGETFPDDDETPDNERRFHDEDDDDIPPPVILPTLNKKFKVPENEEDFFDVSDAEEEEVITKDIQQEEGTKAWRD